MTRILAMAMVLGATVPDRTAASQTAAYRDQVMTSIAAAAGFPQVENVTLPPGYREIRMRAEQPNYCCDPRPMLRMIEGPNDIRGELWLFRTLYFIERPGNPQPRPDERCASLTAQSVICVRPWDLSSGDWRTVAANLDRLGAWTMSDPCRPTVVRGADGTFSGVGGGVADAGGLSVQRLIASTASSFTCDAPTFGREGERLKVKALYDYFIGLNGPIPRESLR